MAQYLYPYSLREALKLNEESEWRLSYSANIACRDYIDEQVNALFTDNHLPAQDIIKTACECHGIDRVGWVLANTVNHNTHDGRYRPQTQKWARQAFYIPDKDATSEYLLESHPELVNGLAGTYQKYLKDELGLINEDQCLPDSTDENYAGQLLIIKARTLADEYKKGEFQYFMAQRGNGCNPSSLGTKVFGYFLADGENCYFSRSDFCGIADPEQYPKWVSDKLENQEETRGMSLE